jgi:three-Cys-motif partner protein
MKQGSGDLSTPVKQSGIVGLINMLSTRWKGIKGLFFIDMYCGTGKNVLSGGEIDGSPISLLTGLLKTIKSSNTPQDYGWAVLFNDISPGRATDILPVNVMAWQEANNLTIDKNKLTATTKSNDTFEAYLSYSCSESNELIDTIKWYLGSSKDTHLVIMIDPNGPKHINWNELKELWDIYKKRVEFIIHISATTLKRVSKAKQATSFSYSYMPDHIGDMFDAFSYCGGWIREPIDKDQWTLALISYFEPKHGWNTKAASFHKISSEKGQEVITKLSLTKAEWSEHYGS